MLSLAHLITKKCDEPAISSWLLLKSICEGNLDRELPIKLPDKISKKTIFFLSVEMVVGSALELSLESFFTLDKCH